MEMKTTKVEAFLLNRIEKAMKESKSLSEQHSKEITSLPLMKLDLPPEFETLKDLIKKKTGSKFDSLYYLYYLTNEIAKWKKLLENPHYCNPEILHQVCSSRNSIKETLQEAQHQSKNGTSSSQSLPKDIKINRWSSPLVSNKIYGIEDKIMVLERLLVGKDRFKKIGIVGMAGVGKTQLCQLAFNNQQVKEHFFPRIWVCLSKQAEDPKDEKEYRKEVVKRMLMRLGFKEDIINKEREDRILLMALRQQLKDKRYLIVLDDVWNSHVNKFCTLITQDGDGDKRDGQVQLVDGLPKGDGAAVIVNSRYEEMTKIVVGEKNVLHLFPLEDKQSCWEIFKDAACKDDGLPQGMEELRDEIIEKCAGLPLAAKMMGRITHKKQQDKTQLATLQEKEGE